MALLAFWVVSLALPSWGRSPFLLEQRASVVMDGHVLFEVTGIANFPAQERATVISLKLEQLLQEYLKSTDSLPQYQIDVETDQAILSFNQSYLLTVTPRDIRGERTVVSQARGWAKTILDAIEMAQYERTPSYRQRALLMMVGVSVGAIAFQGMVRWLSRWGERRLVRWLNRSRLIQEKLVRRLMKVSAWGLLIGLWWAVGYYLTDLFALLRRSRYWLLELLRSSFTDPIFTLNQNSYSLLDLLTLLAFSFALWLGVRSLTRFLRTRILEVTSTDLAVQEVVSVLTQSLLMFLGLLIILQLWGLDVSSLTIIASVLGVGIGFGLQNIANNLISGLIITFERHIEVGDFVEIANLMGIVERIGARSTQILTLDRISIIVPNSRFLETEVINWSHGSSISRLRLPVFLSYHANPEQVRSVLLSVAKSHPEVLTEPPAQVLFKGFGESALNFELLVWIEEPRQQFRLKSDLYFQIEKVFREHNLQIPYPQRDIHFRSPDLERIFPGRNGEREEKPREVLALTEEELQQVVVAMRGEGGVEIQDRWYRGNFYPCVFVAAEAVDWWIQTQQLRLNQAVALGQSLCDRGMIYPVSSDQPFQDSYEFYRFYQDQAHSRMGRVNR